MTAGGLLARAADFAALGRPLHLAGPAIFYGLGLAAAHHAGAPAGWGVAAAGLLTVAAAQLMNHYSNDFYDLAADVANSTPTRWSGGSRVLVDGRLPPAAALWAARGCGALALALAAATATAAPAPWASLALLLFAIALAWVYSGPPLFLHRRGLGEVTGALLVPGLTALVGYQLQAGAVGPLALLAAAPLCLFQFAMLVAVNVPDAAGDAAVGKRTLVVLLGVPWAARLFVGALALAYLALPLAALAGLPWPAALAPLAAAPIGLWLAARVAGGAWADQAAWEGVAFWSIGLLVASAGLMLAAFALI
ncbi:MAG TPA: prenyltransferase [Chloroflexaceae bacterium]|nr:prenyltransferase [Chloroflexaceae bacterium]